MVQELTQLIIDTSPLVIKSTGVAAGMMVAGGVQAVGSIVSGLFGASRAKRAAARAAAEKRRLAGELKNLKDKRQVLINPYASSIKDQTNLIEDLGGNLTNSYANLGVATQAAEMQAEEADIALANTLDTLQASGASAGGATALAQAALASKKGVSATIEKQEVANEAMKAQGNDNLQKLKLSESQRTQEAILGEGARTQGILAKGEAIKMDMTENRQTGEINQVYSQMIGAQNQENASRRAQTQAITGMISGVADGVSSFAQGRGAARSNATFARGEANPELNQTFRTYKRGEGNDLTRKEFREAGGQTTFGRQGQ